MTVEKPRKLIGEDGGPLPEEGGIADEMIVERASATPIAPIAKVEARGAADVRSAAHCGVAPASLIASEARSERSSRSHKTHGIASPSREDAHVEFDLRDLQRWFARGVMDSRPSHASASIESILTQGPRLSPAQRLEIYRYAYRARLVECLADDYPVLQHTIGEAAFEALAKRYIDVHPSHRPNLNSYGKDFAASLDDPFARDLAKLEWAMVEVLHADAPPPLSLLRLQDVAPESRGRIRLKKSPTLRFLEFTYPVNRHLIAVKNGERPPIPLPEWSATAIYREGFRIWRMDFLRPMAGVLSALLEGRTLEEALSTLEKEPVVEGDVMAWFKAWVEGGFFADFDVAG